MEQRDQQITQQGLTTQPVNIYDNDRFQTCVRIYSLILVFFTVIVVVVVLTLSLLESQLLYSIVM